MNILKSPYSQKRQPIMNKSNNGYLVKNPLFKQNILYWFSPFFQRGRQRGYIIRELNFLFFYPPQPSLKSGRGQILQN
jgi:hypothetical protein